MIPLALFLLGCAMVYLGVVLASFSTLMRFSLRLTVERDHGDLLGEYLEEPLRLFVPGRLLLGLILIVTGGLFTIQFGINGGRSLGLAMASATVFFILCEQLIPHLIVRGNPQRVLEALLPSFAVVSTIASPLAGPIVRLSARRAREAAANAEREQFGSGEPPTEVEDTKRREEGDEERRLLRSIVDFGNTLVREVMTPRPDVAAIRAEATLAELREYYREQEYSRIPVFQEDLDNILGIVVVKDLLMFEGDLNTTPVTSLMRPAYFVPETKKVEELLKEFQRQQVQSAIVVDEYGGTAGLVSFEDLLEEIVGEIRDEYDVETEPVTDEGDGSFVISGKVGVDLMAERLGVDIEREGFETVGGYLLSHIGRVPSAGETFEIEGLDVEVLEAERRRIHKVRIRRKPVAAV
jgi:putative hemolysin